MSIKLKFDLETTLVTNKMDVFKKKFPFWQKRDIGVFIYIWTDKSLT